MFFRPIFQVRVGVAGNSSVSALERRREERPRLRAFEKNAPLRDRGCVPGGGEGETLFNKNKKKVMLSVRNPKETNEVRSYFEPRA